MINDLLPEEVLFRAQALGHLPLEYIQPIVGLLEETMAKNPDARQDAVDSVVSLFDGSIVASVLFRAIMMGDNQDLKNCLYSSDAVKDWSNKNRHAISAACSGGPPLP